MPLHGQAPPGVVGLTSAQLRRHLGSLAKLPGATPCFWMDDSLSQGDLLHSGRFHHVFKAICPSSAVRAFVNVSHCPPGPEVRKDPALQPASRHFRNSFSAPQRSGTTHRVPAGDRQALMSHMGAAAAPACAWVPDLVLAICAFFLYSPGSRSREIHACWLRAGPGRGGAGSPPSFLQGKGRTLEGRLSCMASPRDPHGDARCR